MRRAKTTLEIFIEQAEKEGLKVHICRPRPLGRCGKSPSKTSSGNGEVRLSRPARKRG